MLDISSDQINKIIDLCYKGYTNRQIAIELNMKHATLCYWKKKLRDRGVEIPAQIGRLKTHITTIAEVDRITKEDPQESLK